MLFAGNLADSRYAISIIATWHMNKEKFLKCLKSQNGHLENSKEKSNPKTSHKKYRWFCGERTQKTTDTTFSIKSIRGFAVSETKKTTESNFPIKGIGGFAVSETEKSTLPIKSIGGFTVNKTDNRLKKFYRSFFGDFDRQLT